MKEPNKEKLMKEADKENFNWNPLFLCQDVFEQLSEVMDKY